MDSFLAHRSEDGREQTVEEHLNAVSDLCGRFAKVFGDEIQGRLIGLAHDIGKRSAQFQERLKGGCVVDHSTAGAFECAKRDAFWAACCVAGHHGGLPDFGNIKNDTSDDATLFGRIRKALERQIPPYEVPFSLPDNTVPEGYGKDNLTDSFIIRMLFSCLVDADFLDTASFMSNESLRPKRGDNKSVLLDKLDRYINPWWQPSNELNKKRCEILRACIDRSVNEKGLYTLTVPTGGGKTIASMAFALNHALKNGMDRVIYVIPYTSIIEQTADVFRNIFGSENVVEHHSGALFEIEEGGPDSQYLNIKATENWDSPIIVTTAVQFFESLYSNRPSKCRKLHNMANSVIIFDEVQTLPTPQLRPCVAAISSLVKDFKSTAVLCTATQPSLNDLFTQYVPGIKTKELCPDSAAMYSDFRRVTFKDIGLIDSVNLSAKLAEQPQVLCIVNSRKSAQDIFGTLPAEGSFHLSTLMYPMHRRSVLFEIRQRLKNGLPCRVVSTSLVEAGVDIDFPAVYRELAGLDSILQAAGRCNREGRRLPDESVVTVFDGVSATPQLLQVNIGATREALRGNADPAAPETIARYFKSYRSLAEGKLDKSNVISAFEKGISGCALPFRTVAERFHLIDDATKTVYIPRGEGIDLVRRFRAGERSRSLFHNLGQYGVNIYENHFQALSARGVLEAIDENSAILIDLSLYSRNTGLELSDSKANAVFL